jgi:molecular chaperone GrpE
MDKCHRRQKCDDCDGQTKCAQTDKAVSAETAGEEAKEAVAPEKTALERCEEEKEQFKDQWLRALADLENFRKRAEKEREDALKYSISKFAKECLTVLDTLQKALCLPAETSTATVLEGLRLAEKEFLSTFSRYGVQCITVSVGDPFDPTRHQAMFETETTTVQAGCVTEVLQMGYTLQERLLRPALVGVAKQAS